MEWILAILDLSLHLHPFHRFWKKLYIQDYTNTLTKIIYYQLNNMASKIIPQLEKPPSN